MFFLTYIKGTRVNEWVMAVNRWLARQIQGGINMADERLWNEVAASFMQRFADSLAKENAQSILQAGVKMKGEDIDGYIVMYRPSSSPARPRTCIGTLVDDIPDLKPLQDVPTEEDIHYWMHGDDEEDKKDEATVRAELYTEDPQEAIKQCLHCGGAYVEEILDD